jgi:hypothetical protein
MLIILVFFIVFLLVVFSLLACILLLVVCMVVFSRSFLINDKISVSSSTLIIIEHVSLIESSNCHACTVNVRRQVSDIGHHSEHFNGT